MKRALRRALRSFVVGILFATLFLVATPARAQEMRRAGTVRVETTSGGRGPLDLRFTQEGFIGELAIVNDGKEPLIVSRIAVRGDATDPRAPPKLALRLADGALPATIAPGATRKAIVQWLPERGVRLRQLSAHVVVTTSDEQSGEVAMGVRAQIPGLLGPLEGHLVSLLIGVPLLGALLTFLARLLGRRDDRTPHLIAVTSLAVQAMLAIYIYRGFASNVSRLDGNDGLQFIEHGVCPKSLCGFGSAKGSNEEAYLFQKLVRIGFGSNNVDHCTRLCHASSVAALLVTSLLGLLAILPERTVARGSAGYHTAYLTLAATVPGALCAMDGLLFVLFTSFAVIAAVVLVGGWGGANRRDAALKLAILGLSMAFTAIAFVELIHRAKALLQKWIPRLPVRMFAGGVVVVMMWQLVGESDYLGLGVPTILRAFHDPSLPRSAFALKIAFTVVTLGAGYLGGEVTPLFFVGATLGSVMARVTGLPLELGAGVGIAAVFGAAANTPLALAIMAVELMGIDLMAHVVIVTAIAYFLGGHRGIYLAQRVARTKYGKRVALQRALRDYHR